MRTLLYWVFVVGFTIVFGMTITAAQGKSEDRALEKQIAVTVDDLPLNGPDIGLVRLRAMTEKLLAAFKKYKVPAVGFVNESLLYVPGEADARIAVLRSWPQSEVELGNHTFSHLGFKDASLAQYEDDFIRGESVTKMLMSERGQKLRYFRHPYLQMGNTRELERSFEDFIAERGYKIAPVTIDTMDWMFLAAFEDARKANDEQALKRISDDYVKFAEAKFESCENASSGLFGRQIRQILLLHANELNADNLDRLFAVMKDRGYTFIPLERALQDPAYQFPQKYDSTSDWLSLWAADRGQNIKSPSPPDYIQKAYSDNQKASVVKK